MIKESLIKEFDANTEKAIEILVKNGYVYDAILETIKNYKSDIISDLINTKNINDIEKVFNRMNFKMSLSEWIESY
jgi:hypothetical protein